MNERIMRDDRLVDINPNHKYLFDNIRKITDANGVWLFNLSSLSMAFAEYERDVYGFSNKLPPGSNRFSDNVPSDKVPLYKLSPIADKFSICSGAPGIVYRTREAELVLTLNELYRLTMNALTVREFFIIYEAVGDIYEVHNDFYDPETGKALQPMASIPREITDANGVRSFGLHSLRASGEISLEDAFMQGLRDKLSPTDDYPSLLSGAPGIRYCFRHAELMLTPDEAYRLNTIALTPEEYFKIRAAVGEFIDINDDFYDPETGELRLDEDDPDA